MNPDTSYSITSRLINRHTQSTPHSEFKNVVDRNNFE